MLRDTIDGDKLSLLVSVALLFDDIIPSRGGAVIMLLDDGLLVLGEGCFGVDAIDDAACCSCCLFPIESVVLMGSIGLIASSS